jgi:hypothetical protein
MMTYPSIPYINKKIGGKWIDKIPFYFFEKLDGTNIAAGWSSKRGFYKFGTRKGLIGESHRLFGSSIAKIKSLEDDISMILNGHKVDRATLFFEYCGPNSFGGWHDTREEQDVFLIDVHIHKKGFMTPFEFVKNFVEDCDIPTAKMISLQAIDEESMDNIKNGTFKGMSFEGVIMKASHPNKKNERLCFKLKNIEWIEKAKEKGIKD